MSAIKTHRELRVYQEALAAAAAILKLSLKFPPQEGYDLTAQIRRSSRSVCANIAEAWRKKRYTPHFISKLSDAESEAAETQTWLDLALDCGYISEAAHKRVDDMYDKILGQTINLMARAADFAPHRPTAPSPNR